LIFNNPMDGERPRPKRLAPGGLAPELLEALQSSRVELLKRGILFAVMTIDRAWTGAGITAPQMIARAWVMMARA